jgi:hypothetical protein
MLTKFRSKKNKIRTACTTEGENRTIDMKIRVEDLQERGQGDDPGVDRRRELKWILN